MVKECNEIWQNSYSQQELEYFWWKKKSGSEKPKTTAPQSHQGAILSYKVKCINYYYLFLYIEKISSNRTQILRALCQLGLANF